MSPADAATARQDSFPDAAPVRHDVVFDVGMHRGEDTAFYLAMGFDVVGFEADPHHAAACRERFAGAIAAGRVTIVEGAIDAGPGSHVTFFRNPTLSVWGTTDGEWVERRNDIGAFEQVTVPRVDFDTELARHGVPHFLKIDIEGADRVCLEALRRCESRPRYVSIESEKFSWEALLAEFDLLDELGYGRFAAVQQASIPGRMMRTADRYGRPLEYRFERDASGAFGADVGPWQDREAAIKRYEQIFRSYRRWGEGSFPRRFRAGRWALARLPRITGRSMPGWYDTHAMLVD
jgi:FkbM family methyltransferase